MYRTAARGDLDELGVSSLSIGWMPALTLRSVCDLLGWLCVLVAFRIGIIWPSSRRTDRSGVGSVTLLPRYLRLGIAIRGSVLVLRRNGLVGILR